VDELIDGEEYKTDEVEDSKYYGCCCDGAVFQTEKNDSHTLLYHEDKC